MTAFADGSFSGGAYITLLLRVSQLEKVKTKLGQITKDCISFGEFVQICSEGCSNAEQGLEFVKMLDESGTVIVLGNVVFLRPGQIDVWLRVVGPPKNGMTVYGMGSLSYSCLENSTAYRSFSSSSCSSAQPSDYVQTAEFQQSVEESVQKALSKYFGELKEANEHLKYEVASLTRQVRQLKGLDASQDAPSNDL